MQVVLRGKTVLILGYGRVGTLVGHYEKASDGHRLNVFLLQVGEACRGLGMTVVGVRSSIEQESLTKEGVTVHPVASLDYLLPKAQVLLLHFLCMHSALGVSDHPAWHPHHHQHDGLQETGSTPL